MLLGVHIRAHLSALLCSVCHRSLLPLSVWVFDRSIGSLAVMQAGMIHEFNFLPQAPSGEGRLLEDVPGAVDGENHELLEGGLLTEG